MRSRRFSTRREVMVPCQAVRLRDFVLVADRTLDISVDGLLLPFHPPFGLSAGGVGPRIEHVAVAPGDELIVSFPIPGMWIDTDAVVTRVVQGRRPGDDGPAIGVKFELLSASARAALAGFLHGRPPPLPRRGPLSRMRRGAPAPRLADHDLMAHVEMLVNESDVEELQDEHEGLSVLREVGKAWRELTSSLQDTSTP